MNTERIKNSLKYGGQFGQLKFKLRAWEMKTYREKHEINCKTNYDDARKHLHTNT